jgi:hypothetical protein
MVCSPPYNNRFNLPGSAVTPFAEAKPAPVRLGRFCFAGAALTLRPQVNRAIRTMNQEERNGKTQ